MSLARLRRFGFAAWLVAIALIANAAAQNRLALNVVEAATERSSLPAAAANPHAHHDHAAHMAAMQAAEAAAHRHHAGPGGHTHKGYADCAVCGAVAVMAGLTLPATIVFDVPRKFAQPSNVAPAAAVRLVARYERYISRAPPLSV
ncbi:MAG: hypothetical protein IT566_12090 [Rhodospirillaceae bacterium]|nr:hypothetical protein [Rhodospirillaceae bacterium]